MSDDLIAYFGYGSLVNLKTLRTNFIAAYPAQLKGWRRHWQSRATGDGTINGRLPALLSVHRHEDTIIDGMLIIDHLAHLPALDEREVNYQRVVVGDELDDDSRCPVLKFIPPENRFVYVANQVEDISSPLMQSYLDAVMQGFLVAHGEEGVSRFVATTTGFDRDVVTDRAAPNYPRSVDISDKEKELFDQLLRSAGARL